MYNPDSFFYYAIFNADEQTLRRAKLQFIRHFSKEDFDNWLAPYYYGGKPGYIFFAPKTKFSYWFIDRIVMLTAEDLGLPYIRHSQLIAPDIPELPDVINCKLCGRPVAVHEAKEELCLICYSHNSI